MGGDLLADPFHGLAAVYLDLAASVAHPAFFLFTRVFF
jgi:hypothetical protein